MRQGGTDKKETTIKEKKRNCYQWAVFDADEDERMMRQRKLGLQYRPRDQYHCICILHLSLSCLNDEIVIIKKGRDENADAVQGSRSTTS